MTESGGVDYSGAALTTAPASGLERHDASLDARLDCALSALALMAFGLLLEGASGLFLDGFGWLGVLLGSIAVLLWSFQRLATAFTRRPTHSRMTPRLVRYLVVPGLALLAVALIVAGIPSAVRFTLSRDALQAAADQALASPLSEPGDRWSGVLVNASSETDETIGTYRFAAVDHIATGTVVFLVDAGGVLTDAGGFAFNASRQPYVPYAVTVVPLGGGWWIWYEEWD